MEVFIDYRVWRVGELESGALLGMLEGTHRAVLMDHPLEAETIVALQATGQRCLALLPAPTSAWDGLKFALHDLRHLAQFFMPEHHRGQVGFFKMIAAAMRTQAWVELDKTLGCEWREGRDAVLSDMNGSASFLWAGLRSKLEQAIRVRDDVDSLRDSWFEIFSFPSEIRAAAESAGSRRSDPMAWRALQAFFEARAMGSTVFSLAPSRLEGFRPS